MQPSVSLITTCKGRLTYLQQALASWLELPFQQIIIVDVDCPDGTAKYLGGLNNPRIECVRLTATGSFPAALARNTGAAVARGEFLTFLDCDILLLPGFTETLRTLRHGGTHRPDQFFVGLPGQLLIARTDFDRLGGYDEVIRNYGGEDVDLLRRAAFHGLADRTFSHLLLTHIPHPEDLRTRYSDVTDKKLAMNLNTIYGLIKLDLMRLHGSELRLDFRRDLYDAIRENLRAASAPGLQEQFELTLSNLNLPHGRLHRTISYRLDLFPSAFTPP